MAGFNLLNLNPNASYAGDWLPMTSCYGFPNLPAPNQFCGNGLLDVGISQMYNDLPFAQRPAGTYDSNDEVPPNLTMNVLVGSSSSPIASYSYTTVQPPTAPSGPAPTYSQWVDTTNHPTASQIFVNTGRNPLNCYNYMFAGQCGQVGMQKITPSPAGCSQAN